MKGVTIDPETMRLAWVAGENGKWWSSRVHFLPRGKLVLDGERLYKARWLRAFTRASGVLRCVGALDGAPCAHAVLVDLRAGAGTAEREVGAALERLHLDHERPLHATRATGRPRGDARGAAVVGRRAGRRGAVPRPCSGVCARARRTAPRVCAFGAVRRATPRGWCCSLWTTRTAIDRSWARLVVVVGFLDGETLCSCSRVGVCVPNPYL